MTRIRQLATRSFTLLSLVLALSFSPATIAQQKIEINEKRYDFAQLVNRLSERAGYFPSDNLVSNELSYQHVLGRLEKMDLTGGAYLGVGPDQNFTYIVATAPRISWSEAKSEARFEEDVSVERGTQRARAKTATAHMGADRRLERVEMEGDVRLNDSATGRSARAQKATDFPREGRTVLEGSPAVAEDAEGNRVAGATLTITGRGRSVEVTAPTGGTTETVHKTRRN